MWETRSVEVPAGRRIRVWEDRMPMSFRRFFNLLGADAEFRSWYSKMLIGYPFEAFFWEHPPLATKTFDDEAEFVLLDAPLLTSINPEPAPFESNFANQPNKDVLVFPNLGGDAVLIVPRPIGPLAAYPHLAAFLRNAPASQVESLWQAVAKLIRDKLSPQPRWLSTAGLGVAWLHLRLDNRPKYYRFEPYRLAAR